MQTQTIEEGSHNSLEGRRFIAENQAVVVVNQQALLEAGLACPTG